MYRPLVQPVFASTRGQKISPGLTVLATGGPKQRGDLIVRNPGFYRDAEFWSSSGIPITRFDGHITLDNVSTAAGSYIFTFQDLQKTVAQGDLYRVRLVIDSFSAVAGEIRIAIGGVNILGPGGDVKAPNVYNFSYEVVDPPINNNIALYVADANDLSAQLSFTGVYLLSP